MQYSYKVRANADFCASVELPDSNTKCAKPHGYTYKVTATVSSFKLNSLGFVCDYNLLQDSLLGFCQQLDYCNLNCNSLLEGIVPSSENIARVLLEKLAIRLAINSELKLSIAIETRPGCIVEVSQ